MYCLLLFFVMKISPSIHYPEYDEIKIFCKIFMSKFLFSSQTTKFQRINEDLPVPPKLLTATVTSERTQTNRSTANSIERTSHFIGSHDDEFQPQLRTYASKINNENQNLIDEQTSRSSIEI